MPSKKQSNPIITMGEDFRILQEERVKTYSALNQAHKLYLSSGPQYDLEPYKLSVSEATSKFARLSEKILKIRDQVVDDIQLEAMIGKVQECEEKKLRLTVDFQLAKQRVQDNPEDEEEDAKARELAKSIRLVVEDINEAMEEVRYRLADLRELNDDHA